MIEDGTIVKTDNKAIIKQSFLMPSTRTNDKSLSSTASFLCRYGSRNGWELWKDQDGKPLNQNKLLKVKLTKRKRK